MFASARAASGVSRDDVPGATVGEVLDAAQRRYGGAFVDVLASCKIWVNGEPAEPSTSVTASDEIAVLPPVSGGSA
jgi:molybdopterin synthase sulfur carrier subunit